MVNEKYEDLRNQFRKVFEAKWHRTDLANYDELREKFAFHMADIAQDMGDLAQAYAASATCDTKCLAERTEMFFYHCMPHLTAAAQIYDYIPQIFEEQKGVHDWSDFVDEKVVE